MGARCEGPCGLCRPRPGSTSQERSRSSRSDAPAHHSAHQNRRDPQEAHQRGRLPDLLPPRRAGPAPDGGSLDPGPLGHREPPAPGTGDTTYREDHHHIRTGAGPQTMATLRNNVISLIRLAHGAGAACASHLRQHTRHPTRATASSPPPTPANLADPLLRHQVDPQVLVNTVPAARTTAAPRRRARRTWGPPAGRPGTGARRPCPSCARHWPHSTGSTGR